MWLVRLLNAPLLIRRGAAFGFCLVSLGAACAIVAGLYGTIVSTRNEVYEKRQELGRLLAIVELEKTIKTNDPIHTVTETRTEFLQGDNEAAARSGLQKRLSDAAATSNVTVFSAGNAPTINDQGVIYVGLRANVSGSLENVHGLILNIETTLPVLFIREATLTAAGGNVAVSQNSSTEISAQLVFYGVLQTSAAAKPTERKS